MTIKPAISLLEVLVVMGIIAVTIIASFNLAVVSITELKRNEIADYVNSVGIGLLEVSKTPADIYISPAVTFRENQPMEFSISRDENNRNILQNQQFIDSEGGGCTPDSIYAYKVDDTSPVVCVQFSIVKLSNGSKYYYQTTINLVYGQGDSLITQSLKSYRFSDFKFL